MLGLGLLFEIGLDTTLGGLAVGTHLVVVSLALVVAHSAGNGTTDNAFGTVRNAASQIADLALGLLLLSLEVLFAAGLLQTLGSLSVS